jgi:hypothetical protein
MKLSLGIRGKKERAEVESQPFTIRLKDGMFSVTTPMHDDWLQTVNFALRKADASIEPAGAAWVLIFPDTRSLEHFKEWLVEANAKAENGYRTLYP